jgi:hypothetical protein
MVALDWLEWMGTLGQQPFGRFRVPFLDKVAPRWGLARRGCHEVGVGGG